MKTALSNSAVTKADPWRIPVAEGREMRKLSGEVSHSAFDNISSTIKARRAGFHECVGTEDMFAEFFTELRTG